MSIIDRKPRSFKESRGTHKAIPVLLGDWLRSNGGGFKTIEDIGEKILELRKKNKLPGADVVTASAVTNAITQVREYLETDHDCTVIHVRGEGYKLVRAKTEEVAEFALRFVKRSIITANRANRLRPLVDKRHLPDAIRKVFTEADSSILKLADLREPLLLEMGKAKEAKRASRKD